MCVIEQRYAGKDLMTKPMGKNKWAIKMVHPFFVSNQTHVLQLSVGLFKRFYAFIFYVTAALETCACTW